MSRVKFKQSAVQLCSSSPIVNPSALHSHRQFSGRYSLNSRKRAKESSFNCIGTLLPPCKSLTDEAVFAKPGHGDWTLMQLPSITLFETATVKQKETKFI